MEFFVENSILIAALPLWVFLIIVFGQNLFVYDNKRITLLFTLASTFTGLLFSFFILLWTINNNTAYLQNFTWLEAGNIKLSMGVMVDRLSAVMLVMVTSVSLLIQLYSYEYMNKDESFHRFFCIFESFQFFDARACFEQ